MKRLLLVVLLSIVFVTAGYAQTLSLLVMCDTDPKAEKYIVELNGTEHPEAPYIEVRPAGTVVADIGDKVTLNSTHVVRLKAMSRWGDTSDWSVPLEFWLSPTGTVIVRQPPEVPAGIGLISQ